MFVNIAMVLEIVPVVGLWLPFLSYGGTALWLCLSCVGLLMGIRRSEKPVLFS
jgi:cell division protein FtsW (lipid II flippase)